MLDHQLVTADPHLDLRHDVVVAADLELLLAGADMNDQVERTLDLDRLELPELAGLRHGDPTASGAAAGPEKRSGERESDEDGARRGHLHGRDLDSKLSIPRAMARETRAEP